MATHINAYKDELEAALKEAQGAVDKVRQCYERLLNKLDEQPTNDVPASAPPSPVPASSEPAPVKTAPETSTSSTNPVTTIPVQDEEKK